MSDNYKGELQQYCQQKGISIEYHSHQVGPPNDPSWIVTVKWGKNEHTIPDPISGPKKNAEQVAAKHALEAIGAQAEARERKKEAFLAENRGNLLADALTDAGVEAEETGEEIETPPSAEPITVPLELMVSAVGIANHRYTEKKRDERGRSRLPTRTDSDEGFVREIAELTMKLVRELDAAAKRHQVHVKGASDTMSHTPQSMEAAKTE